MVKAIKENKAKQKNANKTTKNVSKDDINIDAIGTLDYEHEVRQKKRSKRFALITLGGGADSAPPIDFRAFL